MSDQSAADQRDQDDQGGVFGNLPASRPGTRSPRRDSTTAARATAPKPAAKPKPKAKPPPDPGARAPRTSAPQPPPPRPAGEPDRGGGLEEIAWAGVAAAAEAATLGVRLANRALEALRGGSERS